MPCRSVLRFVQTKIHHLTSLDGGGDRECGSVSVAENGIITQLCSVPSAYSIGGIYSAITYLMGFKPHEHEYKIMGLAHTHKDITAGKVYENLPKFYFWTV